jgi:adenosylcobinamide-phosphate synthase
MSITITLMALLIEATAGYPKLLLAAIGHPVIWIGRMIGALDRVLNNEGQSSGKRRARGLVALSIVLVIPAASAFVVERAALLAPFGSIIAALLASTLLAQRSLHEHVACVASSLERDGLPAARRAVSLIVGRDPEVLDESGVARAAIESLAENFSDGVVAPAFWLSIGGLAAGAAYKAANTADSMIGHKTTRYRDFGFAAARFDDFVNLPASRLAALFLVLAAGSIKNASMQGAWCAIRRDAHRHKSPNAGWPEAAMAGALGLALAGPRIYGGVLADDAMMGDGRREANAADIRNALALYRRADAIMIVLVALLALAVNALG